MEEKLEIHTVGDLFSAVKARHGTDNGSQTLLENELMRYLVKELRRRTGLQCVYSLYRSGKKKRPVYSVSVVPSDIHPDAKSNLTLAVVKKVKMEKEQLIIRFSDMNDRDYNRPPFLYGADSDISRIAGRTKASYNYFISRLDN